jgi:subtilisin-like proprotein convertase family protein
MFGGSGNDTLNGDAKVNLIIGGDGNDTIFGKGADDEIQGGPGNDSIFGADGDDLINGGPGDDQEFGGNNNDLFQQGPQDFYTSTSSTPIPDTGRVRSSLIVPPTDLNAVDVNVRIYIDHARPQDLWTTLVSPSGAWVRLHEREGNGTPLDGTQFDSEANTNIANLGSRNLSGRFHPEWSMELVQSANPTGEWQLMVDDKVSGTTGSIRGWELQMTVSISCAAPTVAMSSRRAATTT